jgi:hypothetical protein
VTAPFAWHLPTLADEVAAAVAEFEAALRLEQAPHGLDEWDERAWQSALATALRRDHEVALEAYYPSTAGRKLSHRPRCDLVLSPPGRPLHQGESLPFDLARPAEALWVELKVARQRAAGDARDGRYGEQLRRNLAADLRKMAAEPQLRAAALLLIAFTEDEATLRRDLGTFEALLARHEVQAGFRQLRVVPIRERIGHHVCGVALWPTVQRDAERGARAG